MLHRFLWKIARGNCCQHLHIRSIVLSKIWLASFQSWDLRTIPSSRSILFPSSGKSYFIELMFYFVTNSMIRLLIIVGYSTSIVTKIIVFRRFKLWHYLTVMSEVFAKKNSRPGTVHKHLCLRKLNFTLIVNRFQ